MESTTDFYHPLWEYAILLFVVMSVVGCGVFLYVQSKAKTQGAAAGKAAEKMSHRWDEDLVEFNNPLPRWWMFLFYITILFALVYLVLYPGSGAFGGILNWTSANEHKDEITAMEAQTAGIQQAYLAMNVEAIANDSKAKNMGRRMFLEYCAQCHGSDGRGASSFPNLTDNDWLWGDSETDLITSIANGRSGIMPAHGHLDGDSVDHLIAFVRSLSGLGHKVEMVAKGRALFTSSGCSGCHGVDGTGNKALGAPNLTDDIWLHGAQVAQIKSIIVNGKMNQMPPWGPRLGEARVKILAGYVKGLAK